MSANAVLSQEEQLKTVIQEHKEQQGALLSVLQETQAIFGYLPVEALKTISDGLSVPLTEIYGVATFYSQFSLHPKGKYKISVCLGTACYVKGSQIVLDEFKELLGIDVGKCTDDGKFSLDAVRCIGACGLAPVMTVNDDVHGRLKKGDAKKILEKYMD